MPFRPKDKQPAEVLQHWFAPIDSQQFSAMEFYRSIESELERRKVPRLRRRLVEYHEGGFLSDKRVYLRLARERYAFEICAAPFGTGFFFSLRFVEIPRGGWLLLLLYVAAAVAVAMLCFNLGWYALFAARLWFWWTTVGVCFAALSLSAIHFAQKDEPEEPPPPRKRGVMPDFDAFFLGLPVIGEWYESVRKETYYRHDTRMAYHVLVSEIVKQLVEEITSAQGVKLLQAYEYSPILDEFYKRTSIEPPDVRKA